MINETATTLFVAACMGLYIAGQIRFAAKPTSAVPSAEPSATPSAEPTPIGRVKPSATPSAEPTPIGRVKPSATPSAEPFSVTVPELDSPPMTEAKATPTRLKRQVKKHA